MSGPVVQMMDGSSRVPAGSCASSSDVEKLGEEVFALVAFVTPDLDAIDNGPGTTLEIAGRQMAHLSKRLVGTARIAKSACLIAFIIFSLFLGTEQVPLSVEHKLWLQDPIFFSRYRPFPFSGACVAWLSHDVCSQKNRGAIRAPRALGRGAPLRYG
jgi:hypothetical protein